MVLPCSVGNTHVSLYADDTTVSFFETVIGNLCRVKLVFMSRLSEDYLKANVETNNKVNLK